VRSYKSLGFTYVESDWRNAYQCVDLAILETPGYTHLKPFFVVKNGGIWVEFFEMHLSHDMWRQHKQQQSVRETDQR